MTNKEFDMLKEEIKNNGQLLSIDELKEILKKYKHISKTSNAYNYIIDEYFKIKIGSQKLGKDTGIYNLNHGLNCYSDKTGQCNNCKICYAKRDLSTYINSCLYNLAAEINFNELDTKKIINDIDEQIKESKDEILFIRISESGDIKNKEDLKKVMEISDYFNNKYGIVSYTYTHNRELEPYYKEIKNSSLVLTYSYDTDLKDVKKSMIIKKEDLKKYIDNPNYVICGGNCYHCSYCKDKTDLRPVLFVNHKNKSANAILKDILTKQEIKRIQAKQFKDYADFLIKQI